MATPPSLALEPNAPTGVVAIHPRSASCERQVPARLADTDDHDMPSPRSSPKTSRCCCRSSARPSRDLWPELAIVGRAGNGIDALRLLAEHRPTVLFLDIQMPGLTGLEVAKQAAGRCPRRVRHRVRPARDRGLRAGRGRLRDEAREPAAARDDRAAPEGPDRAAAGRPVRDPRRASRCRRPRRRATCAGSTHRSARRSSSSPSTRSATSRPTASTRWS